MYRGHTNFMSLGNPELRLYSVKCCKNGFFEHSFDKNYGIDYGFCIDKQEPMYHVHINF